MSKRKKRPMPKMNKRGRPAKPKDEGPTPEMIAKRKQLVGDGDLQLAGYPLGVLWARKIISQDQHDAGVYYAYLFGRMFGKIHPGHSTPGAYDPELDDKAQEIIEPLWREAESIIHGMSRSTKYAVENCAVYSRLPNLSRVDPKLIKGLNALAEWRIRGRLKVA